MRRLSAARSGSLLGLVLLLLRAELCGAQRFLSQNKASQFLLRHRRANTLFEESKKGNLERECIEELCNKEEAREIFENNLETEYFYPKYVVCLGSHRVGINTPNSQPGIPQNLRTCVQEISNQCLPLPCHADGYERCVDGQGSFTCVCKAGWRGQRCEQDINECEDPIFPAGCSQKCENLPGSFMCSCEKGFYIHNNIHCIDINECVLYPPVCVEPAQCVNAPGTFECRCPLGYQYNMSSHECVDLDECEGQVCEGECVNTVGSFSCHCDGRKAVRLAEDGRQCEKIPKCLDLYDSKHEEMLYLGEQFSGLPVIYLRFRLQADTKFAAEFDFRTFDPEGVILYAESAQDSWFLLGLRSGRIEVQFKNEHSIKMTSGGKAINDGRWHMISVEEQGRSLIIKVDREAVMKIAVNGDLFTLNKGIHELNLTVGGVPFRDDGLVSRVNPRLDGCMKDWRWLTGEDTSIQDTIQHNERMQCYAIEDHSAFYPGHGFAYFNHSHGDNQTLRVHVTLRPASSVGVLFALVHQDRVPFSISLSDYHPGTLDWTEHVLVSFGDVVVASVPVNLCDAQTHTVNVTVFGNSSLLEVDGQLAQMERMENVEALDLTSSYSTFIGGIPDVSLVSAPVSAFYTGCMDVWVNGQLLDVDEAQHKHNDIRSHSCPLVDTQQ
uniref:Protein S n=1 Tax=Cyprinus carpio TaxID=7962 RepID=A0A8C2KHS8_CYPCA